MAASWNYCISVLNCLSCGLSSKIAILNGLVWHIPLCMLAYWKIDCHLSLSINALQRCTYRLCASLILLVSMIPTVGPSSLISGAISCTWVSNCFISLWHLKVHALLSIVFCLSWISPNCSIYANERNQDKWWNWWMGLSRRPYH